MRRSVLWRAGMLCLALACVWLALPPSALAASSSKIIYSFTGGTDGAYPESDLILDAAGNLYGTTRGGGGSCDCGTVFQLTRTKDGWRHQVLHIFVGSPNDGAYPLADLVFDGAGNLYGTTETGGSNTWYGVVFKLAPNSHGVWSESVLYSFAGHGQGMYPSALVFDGEGNLYGTAYGGMDTPACGGPGMSGCGVVFRLTPKRDGTWMETTIYDFAGAPDAAVPIGSLVLGTDGSFYGASVYGGTGPCILTNEGFSPPYGCGTLYKLTPSGGGWTETVIYSFFRGRGFARNPSGGFYLDDSGGILGTSTYGGDGDGTFFQLEQTKEGWEQTILYRFYGDPDGRNPVGRLAEGPQGNLFGATAGGGVNRCGTVFELEPTSRGWKESVLFNLDSSTACGPSAGPIVDSQGYVYGTAGGGSAKYGTVYEVVP
ncbi:MAG: choice-of-anchor tandem repeat GloVer-containing protein [Terriglobales bacterium]|jgi:uncharacterized repeat protein (TIGR03803 family)